VDFFWVWEQISKLNNLLKEIAGKSFCNTQLYMTSVIVEHSCSWSGAICNFLRIVIIIIIRSKKLANDAVDHAWIYPPSTTKQRSSSGPCSSLNVSLNYTLSIKPIYAAFANENILNYHLAEGLDPPYDVASLPDLPGYDRTWGCWMQPLHQHEDLLGTLILQQSKVDASFFYCALVRELNILCMRVNGVKVWRLELQYVSFANRSELFRRNLKSLAFHF